MSISLVSDQKMAETSSKGNQEKWYDAGTDSWYKLDPVDGQAIQRYRLITRIHIEINRSNTRLIPSRFWLRL